ncbi:hypothetical protein EB796_006717 [Bugula neritina]|uniref:RING-type domain-containing protein n=1 Tax=Bugula neritina TaxID=10212 RepID=A0A7J7KAJ9_BUGNE|nr:hypothetical protein EB796_006717 [Bugula neritina]
MASGVFKSVCQDILEPHGVKVGGYRDEIFEKICEEEREKLCCQICYMLAKDAHVCTNKHLFCASCIYAWSLTSDSNTDRCPVCRVSGTYSSDDIITSQLNSMPVRCVRCQWKGQLGDYRCHSHGLEDAGVDLRQAHLPTIRSRNGEVVFPDLCSSLDFERTVEESRRRHQRNYMNTQLAFIEGQNRLAFLLDMFEEDLQRHRDNLTSLVNLQRRYNREQLSEIRRFENELGEVTVTLNNLIEAVNNDVDDVAHRLRRWELPPLTSPVYSISDAINNPTTLQPAPPLLAGRLRKSPEVL